MSRTHLTKEMRPVDSLLRKYGYVKARSKGSHFVYVNYTTHKHISVSKNADWVVVARLLKENGIEGTVQKN